MKVWQITTDEIAEAAVKLQELAAHPDEEHAHHEADDLLKGLLPPEIQAAYDAVEKWYA